MFPQPHTEGVKHYSSVNSETSKQQKNLQSNHSVMSVDA